MIVQNGLDFPMVNAERLIIALYEEFDDCTICEAADHLMNMGWAHQSIQIKNEFWSVEDLFYEYEGRADLARKLKPVQWTGGPPNNDRIYRGSFLTVLLDFLLWKESKECQLIPNG